MLGLPCTPSALDTAPGTAHKSQASLFFPVTEKCSCTLLARVPQEAGQLPEEDSDEEWDEEDEASLGEGGKLGALKAMAQEELCSALCALSELLLASCQGAEGEVGEWAPYFCLRAARGRGAGRAALSFSTGHARAPSECCRDALVALPLHPAGAPPSVSGVEAEVEAALGEARQLSPESPEPLQVCDGRVVCFLHIVAGLLVHSCWTSSPAMTHPAH